MNQRKLIEAYITSSHSKVQNEIARQLECCGNWLFTNLRTPHA